MEKPKYTDYSEDLEEAEKARREAEEMNRLIIEIEDDLLYFTQYRKQLVEAIEAGEPAFTEKDVESAESFIAETKKMLEESEYTKLQYEKLEAMHRETHEIRRKLLDRFNSKGEPS